MVIRPATTDDAAAIAHVHVESWRTTYKGMMPQAYLDGLSVNERAGQWREWLTLPYPVFVAEINAEIVGFAGGGAIREPLLDYDAELFAIYLLKEAQGKGTGTALLRTIGAELTKRNLRSMVAWVVKDNSSGEFYRKSGAVPLSSKEIEIGGATIPVIAYGWRELPT